MLCNLVWLSDSSAEKHWHWHTLIMAGWHPMSVPKQASWCPVSCKTSPGISSQRVLEKTSHLDILKWNEGIWPSKMWRKSFSYFLNWQLFCFLNPAYTSITLTPKTFTLGGGLRRILARCWKVCSRRMLYSPNCNYVSATQSICALWQCQLQLHWH